MFGKKQMGAFSLILILALATVGVGYGLWSQTLWIEGEVNTGRLSAAFSLHEVDQLSSIVFSEAFNDLAPAYCDGYTIKQDCDGDGFDDDDLEVEDKNWVGDCTAVMIEPDLMEVTITNGYPSFNCFVLYDVTNTGTIPLKVKRWYYDWAGNKYVGGFDNGILHVNAYPYDFDECIAQVEPDEQALCMLHVHVEQGAAMETTYKFWVELLAHQWNEEP